MAGILEGWNEANDVWVYASASSFIISGVDRTSTYTPGTRVRCTNNGSTFYGTVVSSSFSVDTTVTLAPNDDYALNNSTITYPYYSYLPNPQGYPFWFNYTPTYSASGSMTYTSVTTNLAKFSILGQQMTVMVDAVGTTGGTVSDTLKVSLSVNPTIKTTNESPVGYGFVKDTVVQITASVFWNDTGGAIYIRKYDDSNFGLGANRSINVSILYGI